MPTWGARNTYPAVITVVTVWVVVGALATIARRFIPGVETNPILSRYNSRVHWRASFSQARLETPPRPILMVLYRPTSRAALGFFETLGSSRDLAARLNQDFIPVKVDLEAEPGMAGLFLPLYRAANNADPGLQIVVLDRLGSLAGQLTVRRDGRIWREAELFSEFSTLRRQADGRVSESVAGLQKSDHQMLTGSGLAEIVDADMILSAPPAGKTPSLSAVHLLAELGQGQTAMVQASIDASLVDGTFDWTNGSFLLGDASDDAHWHESESSVCRDADMVVVLDRLADRTGDESYRGLAHIVFDSIVGRISDGRIVGAIARPIDERSRVCGVSWNSDQVAKAVEDPNQFIGFWTLDPAQNRRLLPRPKDWREAVKNWNDWYQQFRSLRDSATCSTVQGGVGTPERTGYVLWRLIPIAAVWKDSIRAKVLSDLFTTLPSVIRDKAVSASVSDPASVALALFASGQATGDLASIEKGRAVLKVALERFLTKSDGAVGVRMVDRRNPLCQYEVPDIVDRVGTSSASRFLLAVWYYGCSQPGAEGQTWRALARDQLGRLAPAVNSLRTSVDGIVMSGLKIQSGRVILKFGPGAGLNALSQQANDEKATWLGFESGAAWGVQAPGDYELTDTGLVPFNP